MKEVFKMVTNIAFKADSDIINKAKTVFKKNNFSLTGALRIYLEQVALTGEVVADWLIQYIQNKRGKH